VRDAVQLQVVVVGAAVVQQQDGTAATGEECFESQHLAAIAQRVLRQQAHFRQAVEDHAGRLQLLDRGHHAPSGLAQFDLGRMQDRLLGLGTQPFFGHQFEHLHALEGPSVRSRDGPELGRGFRERDVQALLAVLRAATQELQPERGLAGAGGALDQIKVPAGKPATKYVVESGDAGGGALL
jgi:hypothetical protein